MFPPSNGDTLGTKTVTFATGFYPAVLLLWDAFILASLGSGGDSSTSVDTASTAALLLLPPFTATQQHRVRRRRPSLPLWGQRRSVLFHNFSYSAEDEERWPHARRPVSSRLTCGLHSSSWVCWLMQTGAPNTEESTTSSASVPGLGIPSRGSHFQTTHIFSQLFFFFFNLIIKSDCKCGNQTRSWAPTGAVSGATGRRGVIWNRVVLFRAAFTHLLPVIVAEKRPHEYFTHRRRQPRLPDAQPLDPTPRSA